MAKKGEATPVRGTRKKRRRRKIVIAVVIVAVVAVAGFIMWRMFGSSPDVEVQAVVSTGVVMRGEVSNEMTSSGTLQPNDTYTLTSLVTGEILEADFEEGDQVTEGQVLYVIDSSDVSQQVDSAQRNLGSSERSLDSSERSLESSQRSLESAQRSLVEAQNTYNEAIEQLGGGIVTSTQTGYLQSITIHEGDSGQTFNVGTLYNDDVMILRVAFLNTDADLLSVGQEVTVTISDTAESLPALITQKSDQVQSLEESGVLVKYVQVNVTNPGGLTTSDRATVTAGEISSVSDGALEAYTSDIQLNVELPSQVTIASVLVGEGDYVTNGTPLFTLTADSYSEAVTAAEDQLLAAQEQVRSAQDQVVSAQSQILSAQDNVVDAENQVSSANDTLDRYTITAPISGQVITKNMKAGDNISGAADALAVIYDLSELSFSMSIDELDISDIEVGQEVEVTADAFEGVTYTGYVSNVSLAGTSQNGVTTYPVVVTIEDTGDLLPGMNVDGTIILERSEDTLYVPAAALQRGNVVYVQNDTLDSAQSSDESSENIDGVGDSGSAPSEGMPQGGTLGGEVSGSANSDESDPSADDTLDMLAGRDVPEGFTAVQVVTGIISNDYVEILSGLSEGQIVYLSDTAGTDYSYFMGGMDGVPIGGGEYVSGY